MTKDYLKDIGLEIDQYHIVCFLIDDLIFCYNCSVNFNFKKITVYSVSAKHCQQAEHKTAGSRMSKKINK